MPRMKTPVAELLKIALETSTAGILRSGKLSSNSFIRLKEEGYLMTIISGWYAVVRPHIGGDSTAFTPFYWSFISQYLADKYNSQYTVSAEQSLDLLTGETSPPKQLIIISKSGSNQTLTLPHGKSILMYVSENQIPQNLVNFQGVNLMSIEDAIAKSSPETFKRNPVSIRLGLSLCKETRLAQSIIQKGAASAGRIIPLLEEINPSMKLSLEKTFKNLNFSFSPISPEPCSLQIIRGVSPVVTRFQDNITRFQNQLQKIKFPTSFISDLPSYQKQVNDIKSSDIYNSLSIEGYQVTPELIARIEKSGLNPDTNPQDQQEIAALAAKGYSETFKKIYHCASESFSGKSPSLIFHQEHQSWYQALFMPLVKSGILQKYELAGYRANPVYIRNATHVPPQPSVVPDLMETFLEKLNSIQDPIHAGVLGHYGFVFIHPYPDGNGRLSRFLMNLFFAHAKLPWTVIMADRREEYFKSLETITVDKTIIPFAEFILSSIRTS